MPKKYAVWFWVFFWGNIFFESYLLCNVHLRKLLWIMNQEFYLFVKLKLGQLVPFKVKG